MKLNFDERPTARVLSAPDGENLKIQIEKKHRDGNSVMQHEIYSGTVVWSVLMPLICICIHAPTYMSGLEINVKATLQTFFT